MFNFRPTYEPLIKFCKELIAEKKVLMEENEGLKETLRCIRQDNQELRAKLFGKPNDDKLAALEKRVAYLEERLEPKELAVSVAEEKLEVGKWYDARTFEVEKLKELLPVGTRVAITTNTSEDEQRTRGPKACIVHTKVTRIGKEKSETVFYVERYQYVENYWFKIIEE